jgi:hypothetical protein
VPPELQLTVFGKNNRATSVPVPTLRIKPCRVDTFVVLSHRSLPNRWGSFEFRAQLREAAKETGKAPLQARRYLWSFGDGKREETRGPEVTHSYEDRHTALRTDPRPKRARGAAALQPCVPNESQSSYGYRPAMQTMLEQLTPVLRAPAR